jgi:5-methylcytosine-specific restriction enzyme A
MKPDQRSPEARSYRALYATAAWKRRRLAQLADEPLCKFCQEDGRVTAATVADHVVKHNGDRDSFFNGALQSLCDEKPWLCHSRRKQQIEIRGFDVKIGADGYPITTDYAINKTAR